MAYNLMYTKGFLYVALLCAVLQVNSAEEKLVINLQKSAILQLREQASICEKETGEPADTLKKLIDGTVPNTVNSKTFLYCVARNSEFVDNNGQINVDNVLKIVLNMVKGTKEDFADVLKKCDEITLENNIETTYAKTQCMHKKCLFAFDK